VQLHGQQCFTPEKQVSNVNSFSPVTLSEAYELFQKKRNAANDDQEQLAASTVEAPRRLGIVRRKVRRGKTPR